MPCSSGRDALACIVASSTEDEAVTQLQQLFVNHAHHGILDSSIVEGLCELSAEQHTDMWLLLSEAVNTHLANCIGGDEVLEEQDRQQVVASEGVVIQVLKLVLCYIKTLKPSKPEDERPTSHLVDSNLLKLIAVVGDMLEMLDGPVCSQSLLVCEEWTQRDLPQHNQFGRQLLMVLIRRALEPGAKKSGVKSVYKMRHCLPLVLSAAAGEQDEELREDTLDASAVAVKALCACLVCPLFLASDEGVKILALVMAHGLCQKPGHTAMKHFLPGCSVGQASKLAHVYCRAWRAAHSAEKTVLEEDCLQDLMYRYITIYRGTQLWRNLAAFLHVLHLQQKIPAFATMLQRKYNPFLWRSLNYANGLVRANAANVLCDTYPMEDLTSTLEDRDMHLTKAHTAIDKALMDDCPVVRVTAIQGVCKILNCYWLALPKAVIQSWFTLLLTKLAADASSTEVRMQVVKGMNHVVDCPDALAFLKKCLPQLAPSFDDVNAGVRMAMVRLLIKIQALKHISYWSIVSLEHLLHRLAVDTPAVCKLITRLLATPFLPIHRDDGELLQRTIYLISENRHASRVFYQHVTHGLDVGSVVRVLLLIYGSVRGYLLQKKREQESILETSDTAASRGKRPKKVSEGDKENIADNTTTPDDSADEDCPYDDPSFVAGMLDAIVLLWTSNAYKLTLPHNAKLLKTLQHKVARGLPLLSSSFRGDRELSHTLLHLASFLPRSMVPTLVSHCFSRLRALTPQDASDVNDAYLTYVNSLCNWNRIGELLELIEEWVVGALTEKCSADSSSGRRQSSRRSGSNRSNSRRSSSDTSSTRSVRFAVTTEDTAPLQPATGVMLLRAMLVHPLNKLALLQQNNRQHLLRLVQAMEAVMVWLESRASGSLPSATCPDDFLLSCWREYLCVMAILTPPDTPASNRSGRSLRGTSEYNNDDNQAPQEEYDTAHQYTVCLEWAVRVLIPKLQLSSSHNNTSDSLSLLSDDTSSSNTSGSMSGASNDTNRRKRKSRHQEEQQVSACLSVASDAIVTLLEMSAAVLATKTATPCLALKVVDLASKALAADSRAGVISSCLLVCREVRSYVTAYPAAYAEHLATLPRNTIPLNPDVLLLKQSITTIVDNIKPETEDAVRKQLTQQLTSLPPRSELLQDILRHCVKSCLKHTQGSRDLALSGVGIVVATVKNRPVLAQLFVNALQHVVQHDVKSVNDRIAVLHFIEYLMGESGKIPSEGLKATITAIDQLTATGSSNTRPAVDCSAVADGSSGVVPSRSFSGDQSSQDDGMELSDQFSASKSNNKSNETNCSGNTKSCTTETSSDHNKENETDETVSSVDKEASTSTPRRDKSVTAGRTNDDTLDEAQKLLSGLKIAMNMS